MADGTMADRIVAIVPEAHDRVAPPLPPGGWQARLSSGEASERSSDLGCHDQVFPLSPGGFRCRVAERFPQDRVDLPAARVVSLQQKREIHQPLPGVAAPRLSPRREVRPYLRDGRKQG